MIVSHTTVAGHGSMIHFKFQHSFLVYCLKILETVPTVSATDLTVMFLVSHCLHDFM